MKLWPSKKQWNSWSLPSRYAFISVFLCLFGILLAIGIFTVNHFSGPKLDDTDKTLREEKLFVAQNEPLIDVTPISITQTEDSNAVKHGLTLCSITNYSGFVAYNIVIDLRYGEKNNWISEWLKAENDRNEKEEKKAEKKGVVKVETFLSAPKALKPDAVIKELKPDANGISIHIGLLDLEKTSCNAGYDGYPVFVRVTWENEKGHVFDEIHKYKLLCTKKDEGRSFTFIPEGVISHKDKK